MKATRGAAWIAIAIESTGRTTAFRSNYRCVSAVLPGTRWQQECDAQFLSSFADYRPEQAFPAPAGG